MADVRITISPGLLTLDERINRRLAVARVGVANLVEVNVKQAIREVGAVASGELVNSIERKPSPPDTIRVGTDKVQGPIVEEGRPPGAVPPWPRFKVILRAWAAAKNLRFSDSALWFIAQKIRREGFKGRFPFKTAAERSRPQVVNILRDVFRGL
jgi:hypothetical protein